MTPQRICIVIINLLIGMLTGIANVQAANYYVAPSGSGSSCTQSKPCSLNTGLDKAGAGDEVVLKDGIYQGGIVTKRSGVVIKAEKKHGAIIHKSKGDNTGVRVLHSDITISGLFVDGRETPGTGLQIKGVVHNSIIEHNRIENVGNAGIQPEQATDVIIRHNIIRNTGLTFHAGEGMYLGSINDQHAPNRNIQVYGNTIIKNTDECFHIKPNVVNMHIHHNICRDSVTSEDQGVLGGSTFNNGPIVFEGRKHNVHDNAFINYKASGTGQAAIKFFGGTEFDIHNNVFKLVKPVKNAIGNKYSGKTGTIHNNTFCSLNTYSVQNESSGVKIENNNLNALDSVCDAEIERILNEMKNLPGVGGSPASGLCHTFDQLISVPQGYGAAYNVHTVGKELLLAPVCDGSASAALTVGDGANTTLVYNKGYHWDGSAWKQIGLQCTGSLISRAWCEGEAKAEIPVTSPWHVAYTCHWTGSAWKCGCRDGACSQSYWQLQGVK